MVGHEILDLVIKVRVLARQFLLTTSLQMRKEFFNSFKNFIVRFDLAFLIFFIFIVNLPFTNRSYMPGHDTKQSFELFYFFYNQLFFQHSLAQWMSFEPFGLVASLRQLQALDPFSYLAMLIGLVFRVQDVLILYKLSIFFEWLILLFGMYLLSRQLFKQRSTAFFVCLVLLNQASKWWFQIYFDLRIFDMLPITIYTFVLFFEKKKIVYLWLTLVLFCLWLMGSGLYTAELWVFAFLVLGGIFWLNNRHGWQDVFSSGWGIRWLVLAGVLLVTYTCMMHDFKNGFDVEGRGDSGILPINNFLVHGGPSQSLPEFFKAALNYKDTSLYIGVMPVFFFFWGLFCVRDKNYYAFLLTTAALWALSFQGILSLLFYFIPGMFFYHHLAWFWGLTRIFFIICAGFGMEGFMASPIKQRIKYLALIMVAGAFLADAVRLSSNGLFALATDWGTNDPFISHWLKETDILSILAPIFLLMIVMIFKAKDKAILFFIFAVVFFNSWSVHSTVHKDFLRVSHDQEAYLYTVNVHPIEFQNTRTMEPGEGRQKDAYLLAFQKDGTNYSTIHDFAQFDACHSQFRTDAFSRGFDQLMKTRREISNDLLAVLGCGVPKIRLVSNAVYYQDPTQALEHMRSTPEMFSTLVLSGNDALFAKKKLNENQNGNTNVNVDVRNFVDDDLTAGVDVFSPSGGWLVYADSYNPGWHATVDGKESPVYQAYLAFKAIWVDVGHHKVHFFYRNTPVLFSSYIVAMLGVIAGGWLIFLLVRHVIYQVMGKRDEIFI